MAQSRNFMGTEHVVCKDDTRMNFRNGTRSSADVPELGVLIKTATPSPVVKNIYCARVTRKEFDVLCIKSNSFEIKQIDEDLNLKITASRDDIDGLILSSLVLTQFEAVDNLPDPRSKDASRPEQYKLPPGIIVLAIQKVGLGTELSRNLIFTFGYHDRDNNIQFATRRSVLPNVGDNTMGLRMASDSKAGLLAVCAQSGGFLLYKLSEWTTMREQVEQKDAIDEDAFAPVKEERQIRVENYTMLGQMAFVPSPSNEPNVAYLLISTEDSVGPMLLVYKIDLRAPFHEQNFDAPDDKIRITPPIEPRGVNSRLLLIPLGSAPGLILCKDRHLTVITDIRRSRETTRTHELDHENEDIDDPGFFRSNPIYPAWVRPIRRRRWWHEKQTDVVYLFREDGQVVLLKLEVETNGSSRPSTIFLGHFRSAIDKACAMSVPLGAYYYDMLMTSGSHSNGVLMSILARDYPQQRLVIPSSGPVVDFSLVPSPANSINPRNRIFATTNRGRRHGTISEIRHGHGIRIFEEILLDADVNKMWLLPFQGISYLVTAGFKHVQDAYRFKEGSDAVYIEPRQPRTPCSWSKLSRDDGFDCKTVFKDDCETITIGLLQPNIHLRITTKSIQRLSDQACWIDIDKQHDRSLHIVAASIDSHTSSALFITTHQGTYELCYLLLEDGQWLRKKSGSLGREPSSLHLLSAKNSAIAIVGFRDGILGFYNLNSSIIHPIGEHNLGGSDGICESIVSLSHPPTKSGFQTGISLLCGLRSGDVKLFDIARMDNEIVLQERDCITIESTAVHVVPMYSQTVADDSTTSCAIIYSESSLYCFTDTGHKFTETNLKQLWFVNSNGKGVYQSIIDSVLIVSPLMSHGSLNLNDVLVLSRSSGTSYIRRCRLQVDEKPRNIPWQIPVGGTPCRVMWSKHHKILIVGVDLQVLEDEGKARSSKTLTFSALKIIDPHDPNSVPPMLKEEDPLAVLPPVPDKNDYSVFLGKSGDQISSLAEWPVHIKGAQHNLIMVSTNAGGRDKGFTRGRLLAYRCNQDKQLQFKFSWTDPDAIYGIAAFDSRSCIVTTATALIKLQIDQKDESLKLHQAIRTELRATTSRHLSVQNGLIRIGTKTHALQVYEIRNQSFVLIGSDSIASDSGPTTSIPLPSTPENGHKGQEYLTVQVKRPYSTGATDYEISCHYQPCIPKPSGHLKAIFSTRFSTIITGLAQASLRPLLRPPQPQQQQQQKQQPNGIINNKPKPNLNLTPYPRILVSSFAGAFYSLDIIPLALWRVLHILQILLQRDGRLTPFSAPEPYPQYQYEDSKHTMRRNVFSKGEKPEERNVDGDIIVRVMSLPNEEALGMVRKLIEAEDVREDARDAVIALLGEDHVRRKGGVAECFIEMVREVVDAP